MHRLWEILLGLNKGFLGRDGELHWHFSPAWPKSALIQAGPINWLVGILAAAALIFFVRRGAPATWSSSRRLLRRLGLAALYIFLISLLSGPAAWNFVLAASALALIIYVYRQEGRSPQARIMLGAFRLMLLAFVLALLNRPVVTLVENINEPSV